MFDVILMNIFLLQLSNCNPWSIFSRDGKEAILTPFFLHMCNHCDKYLPVGTYLPTSNYLHTYYSESNNLYQRETGNKILLLDDFV